MIAAAPPNRVDTFGPFVSIAYYPGVDPRTVTEGLMLEATTLTAKNGRLISAGSHGCTFERIYFDLFTIDDREVYGRLFQDKIKEKRKALGMTVTEP